MARYSPTVLPRYMGGDPGSAIADALDQYVQGKRQERFDDLAATRQEIDLLESGYRPDAADLEPAPGAAPAAAVEPPDEAALALERMRQGPPTLGDVSAGGDMLMRHGPMGDQQRGGALPQPFQDPRTPPAPGAGALAQQMGRRYFELAGGGVYVPGASKQERLIRDERGYRDRVRGEENQLTDRRIQDDRGYRDRVRTEEFGREDRLIQDERGYRDRVRAEENRLEDVRRATERGFRVADREDSQAHELTATERAAQLRAEAARAQGGGEDDRWVERRKAAIRVLGEPTTPLRQDIADALADGATPQQILEKLRQVAPGSVQAAQDYLQVGEMHYEGAQTPRGR